MTPRPPLTAFVFGLFCAGFMWAGLLAWWML